MTQEQEFEEQLQRLADGQMSEKEKRNFLEKHQGPELTAILAKQQKIDDALSRLFSFDAPSLEEATAVTSPLLQGANDLKSGSERMRRGVPRWAAIFALASSVAFVSLSLNWFFHRNQISLPAFQQTSLVKLYWESVNSGFEPYYECEDDQRFADVFLERQGVPLALANFPEGTRMLGLSYPGGISRDTTSMLCEVEGDKAIVFVDRVELDNRDIAKTLDSEIHVHRQEKFGLVFYEVTPRPFSHIIKWMEKR